jgi:hypothetical protein
LRFSIQYLQTEKRRRWFNYTMAALLVLSILPVLWSNRASPSVTRCTYMVRAGQNGAPSDRISPAAMRMSEKNQQQAWASKQVKITFQIYEIPDLSRVKALIFLGPTPNCTPPYGDLAH